MLRYLNEVGLDGDVERLQKAAVSNPIYDPLLQLGNTKWMDAYGSQMIRDLQDLYHFNSSDEVIEGIIKSRAPMASNRHIVDSVLVAASTDNELVSFANSNACALHLSTFQQPFRYKVYSNRTAFAWGSGRFLKDMMNWFKNEQTD